MKEMPGELTTKAETTEHNQREFERQQKQWVSRSSSATNSEREHHERPIDLPSVQKRKEETMREESLASRELQGAILSAANHSERALVPHTHHADIGIPLSAFQKAFEFATQFQRRETERAEPIYTVTQSQLASIIDGSTNMLIFNRDMDLWYRAKREMGCCDVRLEDYEFRCEEFRRELAKPKVTGSIQDVTDTETVRPIPKRIRNESSFTIRLKIEGIQRVAAWDREEDAREVGEDPESMGAGLYVSKRGKIVEIRGQPIVPQTIALDFGAASVTMAVNDDCAIINGAYVLADTGVIRIPRHPTTNVDWRLQFMEVHGPQRFRIHYKEKFYVVQMDEGGVEVVEGK